MKKIIEIIKVIVKVIVLVMFVGYDEERFNLV